MADVGYVNEAVRKMYGIPLSKLTPQQRKILHEDSERRRKLIAEREEAVKRDNLKAFQDNEQFERVLKKMYQQAQKNILSDVTETLAKVERDGGTWSYANQSALTRSRGLFDQINAELSRLGSKEVAEFNKHLSNIYTDQFLRSLYTLGQTEPLRGSAALNMLNPRMIEAALNYPWSGAMFSDRLWLDKERLGRNLRIGLTQSMILGEGIPELTRRIQNGINTSEYNAERVARTEVKRVSYVSQVEAWKSQGVKEVRYMCANNGGDSRTCEYCKSLHGNTYTVGEEPSLPRHPNCRCWYVPVARRSYGDNELNELTGSVRGSENYEKWKQAQEAKLAEQLKEEKKEKSPQDLISEKVAADKKKEQDLQRGIKQKISTLESERDNVPSLYADRLSEIEVKKSEHRVIMDQKAIEMDDINNARYTGIPQKRKKIMDDFEAGKITESEYDELSGALRTERRELKAKFDKVEEEYYQHTRKFEDLNEQIKAIQREIKQKQDDITKEIQAQGVKIAESMLREMDFDLDIAYVGDSMERYEHLEYFRNIRLAARGNLTFDLSKYGDELVQMAQRMDEDALIIHSTLSDIVKGNLYNYTDRGAAYWPSMRQVKMSMKDNAHERSLGNGLKGSWQTKYHEEGHQLDHLLGKVDQFSEVQDDSKMSFLYLRDFTNCGTVSGIKISEAIEADLVGFLNDAIKYSNEHEGQSYKAIKSLSKVSSDARFAFSRYIGYLTSNGADSKVSCQLGVLTDAIGLFTKDKISRNTTPYGGWGHKSSYNKERGRAGANSETWATFCALRTCGSADEVAMMKKVMPKTWDCMSALFHEIAVYAKKNGLQY